MLHQFTSAESRAIYFIRFLISLLDDNPRESDLTPSKVKHARNGIRAGFIKQDKDGYLFVSATGAEYLRELVTK
jgi:hypothetical protein